MIYQLIKFKSHRVVWALALFGGFLFSLLYRYASSGAPLIFVIWVMISGTLFGLVYPRRYLLFEAALPVHARDLYGARVLASVAWTWLFLLASLLAVLYTPSAADTGLAAFVFEAGSILTLAHLGIYSMRAVQINGPRGWGHVVNAVSLLAISILFIQSDITAGPMAETVSILAFCWLGSAALFLTTWTSLPESFQLAPQNPITQSAEMRKLEVRSRSWWPAARALFDLGTAAYFCVLLAFGWMGAQFFGFVFGVTTLARRMGLLRNKERWLLLLPISRHTIFAINVCASLGGFALGSLIRLHSSSLPPGVVFLELAAVVAASLLAALVIEIPIFASGLRPLWALVVTLGAFAPLLWGCWRWLGPTVGAGRRWRTTLIEVFFAALPPAHLPFCIAVALLIVAALYGLAYLGFHRMEFPPQRINPAR